MLVLSRHKDQSVCIGEDITIVVVDIRGDKVRLGIEAPKNVAVHRLEVYNAIQREGGNEPRELGSRPPKHAGFYWWRKLETEEWRIVALGELHLNEKWLADYGGFWGSRITPPPR